MRIIDFRPENTPFKDGQVLRAGSNLAWRAIDTQQPGGHLTRHIHHYDTFMGFYEGTPYCEFCATENTAYKMDCYKQSEGRGDWKHEWTWVFHPESIGNGSVSDQNGMNQLMGFRYYWNYNGDGKRGFIHDYGYVFYRDQPGGGPRIVANDGEVVCD